MKRRSPILGLALILLMGVAAVLSGPEATAQDAESQSNTSILLYDKKGRVIGSQRSTDRHGPRVGGGGRSGGQGSARAPIRPSIIPRGLGLDGAVPGGGVAVPGVAFEDGEILVAGDDPVMQARAEVLGFRLLERTTLESLNFTVLRYAVPGSARTEDALRMFRGIFPGADADFNALFDPSAISGPSEGAQVIGWRETPNSCGTGIRIGMIDTPVDDEHIALSGRHIWRKRFVPEGRREAAADHGTAIATLLVGQSGSDGLGGLLPGASLLAASIFEQREAGKIAGNLYSFLMALDWMVTEKVSVLNMSLETGKNALLSKGLDRARDGSVLMTAAAGNGGARAAPAHPAAHPDVLAVTAVSTRLVPFRQANHGNYIDFSAPGVRLWTAVPGGGGRYQSGTSLAVPFVTAVAALHIASGFKPEAASIRGALIPNVRDLGAPGKDDVYGWGLVRFRPRC